MTRTPGASDFPWWRGAVIYQVYPRSYADADGDGVGDLVGLTDRLEHIASLNVDALWLSPIYASPMKDFGYDVSDYCDVDPLFGTLADFDAMLEKAHGLGLKVLVDQVYSHTSDEHEWFAESRSSRDNPKADWYVWADAKADGTPPNNWQSMFGGPAWKWDPVRAQYYMHNFLVCQPQLNLHNLEVQDALLGVAKFWLDRGVDGFRMDALNFAMHDPQLRDNPPAALFDRSVVRPFDFQHHTYSQFHKDTPRFLEKLRKLTDQYEGIFTLAEVCADDGNVAIKRFIKGTTRMNSAYGFDFLYAPELTPHLVQEVMSHWPDEPGMGWPSWAFENHDAPRAVSRWVAPEHKDAFAKVKLALLVALRGTVIAYQGEELGLEQDEIPYELLKDPEAINNWPRTLSRDGARTPLPWDESEHGGFTTGHPWLPLGEANAKRAVSLQEGDPGSTLNIARAMFGLRKHFPALRLGGIENCQFDSELLVLDRVYEAQRIRCLFNLGPNERPFSDTSEDTVLIASVGGATRDKLPGFSALFWECDW
ncbi:alpha-amylase family glycosyl hydrolase [Croceicoccus gelatinilyticus]|uniref:alpha-amylase family glycosyl hydrolase n=1 Tax=Croceicoccus gelatinilyticus TaxID=2835536 RepID=UPI001BCC95B2|nr:alpha-amylase family glycosyl hydrolase [Croceicoccus gelatinilyticus]MBS7670153.1 alpha-glucosidase [Croceicoccus gelatinilyticus]